jgi:spore coat polysaccharide biosynthesis protein SpsF
MSEMHRPVAAIVQARMTSSRLPGKVLLPLAGAPLVRRMVERVMRIPAVDHVVVALAEGAAHDPVVPALSGLDVTIVRGPEDDVLARTAIAARACGAQTVMRITSDCPLIDPAVSAGVLHAYAAGSDAGICYVRTAFDDGFPLGFDTEVFPASALYAAEAEASDSYEREHATPFIWRRPERFPAMILSARPSRRHWRLVVDVDDDYRLVSAVYDALYPKKADFGYPELQVLFETRPELLKINAGVEQRPYVGIC